MKRKYEFKLKNILLLLLTLSYVVFNLYAYRNHNRVMSFRVVRRYGSKAMKIALVGEKNTFSSFLKSLKQDASFRELFNDVLARVSEYDAFFFECPAINADSSETQRFEFILRKSETLSKVSPNPRAFSSHLPPKDTYGAAVFPNLGRDAMLVAPSDAPANADYAHLASFVRNAPPKQVHIFWRDVATATLSRLKEEKDRPVWLSTSGLGISWLHVRLDTRPKYYTHDEYRIFSSSS